MLLHGNRILSFLLLITRYFYSAFTVCMIMLLIYIYHEICCLIFMLPVQLMEDMIDHWLVPKVYGYLIIKM